MMMACKSGDRASVLRVTSRVLAVMLPGLMLGACAQVGGEGGLPSLAMTETSATAPASVSALDGSRKEPASELEKATEYWGGEFRKNPRDLQKALSYARNLKAMGHKAQAMSVLQQASMFHGQDRDLASEYGRLALDLGQTKVAGRLLALADDPSTPDWRVISARGTVLAKQGKYDEAIPLFAQALQLSGDQPSVLNNLALAYTMSGKANKAEEILRRAANQDSPHVTKVRQNLALVLGLQGKYEEARLISGQDVPREVASADVELLQQMTGTQAKPMPAAVGPAGAMVAGWMTEISSGPSPAR